MKPPYAVPLMTEIKTRPKNGYKVFSTFSGCGGSCLGFKMAGFEILWANEFVPEAQTTYRVNHPEVELSDRDIRTVEPSVVLKKMGMIQGELDVLEGSPPCASFSTAGKREKKWGTVNKYSDTKQRTDDLFLEFIRLLRGFKPKVFIAENVSGLVKGVAVGMFKEFFREFEKAGYVTKARLLDAQWLGVPQARQRVIFFGTRQDLHVSPAFPEPFPYRYTIRDALPWVRRIKTGRTPSDGGSINDLPENKMWGNSDVPSPTIVQSDGKASMNAGLSFGGWVEAETDISKYAIGREWEKLHEGQQSDKYFNLVRTSLDHPCPTVTASGGVNSGYASVTHPTEKRKFSIAELRRICGFPDDFKLTGTYAQQWERLGRSVPPLMMFEVAKKVEAVLKCLT